MKAREVKRCGLCGASKALSEFHRRGVGRQSWCIGCRKAYDAEYYMRTRDRQLAHKKRYWEEFVEWYRQLKTDRPCADCGRCFHHSAMTWDHLPGSTKVAELSTFLSKHRSRRMVLEEIAKCELVCANCHAVRTWERRRGVAQSG
jgi:hypothetical protein